MPVSSSQYDTTCKAAAVRQRQAADYHRLDDICSQIPQNFDPNKHGCHRSCYRRFTNMSRLKDDSVENPDTSQQLQFELLHVLQRFVQNMHFCPRLNVYFAARNTSTFEERVHRNICQNVSRKRRQRRFLIVLHLLMTLVPWEKFLASTWLPKKLDTMNPVASVTLLQPAGNL